MIEKKYSLHKIPYHSNLDIASYTSVYSRPKASAVGLKAKRPFTKSKPQAKLLFSFAALSHPLLATSNI